MDPDQQAAIPTDDDNSGAAPVQQMPDIGPAPIGQELGQDTMGEGMSKLGNKIGSDIGEGWQNLKNSGVGRAVQRVGGLLSGGEGNPAAPSPQPQAGQPNPKVVSYLMGADAAHPDVLEQIGKEVDPEGKLPPADRNLLALDKVRDTKGDNAAWSIMQANRVAYNAQTAFASTALKGTPQKPADVGAAIDAANKAQANVLDGSNISFAHHGAGITATVTMPGTSQPQTIQLSPQAFAQWLTVGGDGQWDKVVQKSAPATLQALAQQYPAQAQTGTATVGAPAQARQPRPVTPAAPAQQAAPQQADQQGDDEQDAGDNAPAPAQAQAAPQAQRPAPVKTPTARDVTDGDQPALPGTHDAQGHSLRAPEASNTNYGEELEARSTARFGKGNIGTEPDRQQWMANQEQEGEKLKNNVDVAAEKGKNALAVAQQTGADKRAMEDTKAGAKVKASENYSQGRLQAALAKVQQQEQAERQKNGHSATATAMAALRTKVGTGIKLNENEQAYWDNVIKGTPEPAAPAGQKQAPAAAQPAQPSASAPKPGYVKNGWKFNGGDPSQQTSWQKVQ